MATMARPSPCGRRPSHAPPLPSGRRRAWPWQTAYIAEERRDEALALLDRLAAETSEPESLGRVLALVAVTREESGDWRGAIEAYQRALALDDSAALDVRWRIAKAHVALSEDAQAMELLRAMDLPEVPTSRRAEILEELAMAQRRAQATDDALATYEKILGFAVNAPYRALLQFKMGETLREAERTEQAIAQFQALVRDKPTTHAAYVALMALDEMGQSDASDLARAEILYAAREYNAAIVALQRHLAAAGKEAQAYYTLGLCYQQTDQYEAAFASFDVVIEDFPAASPGARSMDGQGAGGQREWGRPLGLLPRDGAPLPKACAGPRGAMAGGGVPGARGELERGGTILWSLGDRVSRR